MWNRKLLMTAVMSFGLTANSVASPADNKQAAIAAMTDIFSNQDPSAVDRYFTSPYRQHNTHIPDGLEALKGLAQTATTWRGVHTSIYRALADGDLVVLHSAYQNLLNQHETAVAFDLFWFNTHGKIIEHWDALEPLREAGTSGHSQIDGATEIRDTNDTAANRATVQKYINRVKIAGNLQEKLHFLAVKRYVEHEPAMPRMFAATEQDLTGRVNLTLSELHYVALHQCVAEGNFVLVQSEGRLGNDTIVEIFDLFRLSGGKIVEHWDIHQPVPPPAKWLNTNGPL